MAEIRLRQRVLKFIDGNSIKLVMRDRGIVIPDTSKNRWAVQKLSSGIRLDILTEAAARDSVGEDSQGIQDLIAALENLGALERIDLQHDLSPYDLERHVRTLDFLSAEESDRGNRFEMQARVRDSQVLLIGTGGLGSWVAYGLAAAGLGSLRLVDPDVVALSNLNRSILYDHSSIGRPKAEVARERLTAFAPTLQVDCRLECINGPDDVARLAAGCDLIINVADQPHRAIRRWAASGSLLAKTPVLDAGGGRIGPFYYPGQSSCSGCLQASQAEPGSPRDVLIEQDPVFASRPSGSLSAYPASESGVVVLEAYRFLSGVADPATKNAYLAEGKNLFDGHRIELPRHPRCRVCA